LFLANNISKMKTSTGLGSRIVEVHSASSLFTGKAGSGSSNLRRYIIENDLLEVIVAMPEKMFYNTGIGTFLWVVTNKKDQKRRGKVQLIDATNMKAPLRKNLGEKNCELTADIRKQIVALYLSYTDADEQFSKVFNNEDFGYYSIGILRPLRLRIEITDENLSTLKNEEKDVVIYDLMFKARELLGSEPLLDYNAFMKKLSTLADEDGIKLTTKRIKTIRNYFAMIDENAKPVLDTSGKPEPDKNLSDTEQIPLTYDGGIQAFFENEIQPYLPDSWIDVKSITLGYELSFTKYFYKPVELREFADIIEDIQSIETRTDGLLTSIIGGVN